MFSSPLGVLKWYLRRRSAAIYAANRGLPGIEFELFGRRIGYRLLMGGHRGALNYLLNPVSSVRYFEYSFALVNLPARYERCLDVSSPRLFSLYVVAQKPSTSVLIINPDSQDISLTAAIAGDLRLSGVHTEHCGVEGVVRYSGAFDCVWSLSVVEHIHGDYDDRAAIVAMYQALKPGGRLILTVPVDRRAWDEYRDRDYYGLATAPSSSGRYFFQRFYDKAAICERLLAGIEDEVVAVGWFGETSPGRHAAYVERWLREGYECTVDDPREFVDHYQEFAAWDDMPGVGVCGLVVEKKAAG